MATQTGSIDLRGANSAKLYVDDEAGEIRSEVSETYATKTEVRRTDSGTGTVITSDDAANLPPLSLTIHGKSVQDGTPSPSSTVEIRSVEGLNLYDPSTSVSGYLSVSGTIVAPDLSNRTSDFVPVEAGAWYSFYMHTDDYSAHQPWYCIQWFKSDKTFLSSPFRGWNNKTLGDTCEFKQAPTSAAYVRVSSRWMDDPHKHSSIFFTKGFRFAAPLYGMAVNVHGLNCVDPYWLGAGYCDGSTGFIVPSDAAVAERTAMSIPVTAGDSVMLVVSGCASTPSPLSRYMFMDEDGNRVQTVNRDAAAQYSVTSTSYSLLNPVPVPNGAAFLIASFRTYGGTPCIRLDGSNEFVEHQGASTPIDLQGNKLCSTPSGTNGTLGVDSEGNVTFTKMVGAATINGSEGFAWLLGSTQLGAKTVAYVTKASWATKFDALANVAATAKDNVICDRLPANNDAYNLWDGPAIQVWVDDSAAFMICVGQSFSTSADFNTWLQSNPLTVYYPLATPQTISLGKIDLPSLPSPSFSLHVDALVTPTLDAEWWTQGGEEVGSVYQRTSALEQDVDGITLELSEKVDSSEEWVSWLHAGTDATTHEPYLAMGKDSDYPSVVYGTDAARFYDGEGDDASNVVASFGTEGAVVGNVESSHMSITPEVTAFHDANGNEAARISMSDQGAVTAWASYSVNPTTSWTDRTETGITPLPDFTLGDLELTVSVDGDAIHSYSISSLTEPQISVTYGDIDIKFQATKSGETWTAAMSCRNRNMSTQPTVTFGLSWEHIGTAPMWKFGGASNQGAYSFSAGDGNQPTGEGAVTLGLGLKASRQAQVVVGKHNKPYQSARFIVGNGADDAGRSNALAVTDQGIETVGYIQTGGTVGLGSEAQQAWQTALGINNLFHFKTVNSSAQSVGSGSVVEFTAGIPAVSGMTCRGATQVWTSGTGTTIVGAPWRTSADSLIHSKVRGNVASNVTVYWLLFYTADAFTTTS